MPKLPRVTVVQFGASGASTDFGQFGSKAAAAPQTSQNPSIIQQLAAWATGWTLAAVGAAFNPYLEDMNGAFFVFGYFLANMFERGIPDWDAGTTYYRGAVVQDPAGSGQQWYSLTDNNLNNAPPLLASNAQWQWNNPPPPTVPGVGNALKAALTVAPNIGAPNTKVDIAASTLSVQGVSLATVAQTCDITVSGAGGLDTGAAANNTWYAIHVITNATGSLVSSLFSLSATAPTLPAGYTLFRRVGWVRRDGSGNFRFFTRTGDWVYYKTPNAYASPTGAAFSFAVDMPSTSILAQFGLIINGVTPGGQNWGTLFFTTPGESNQTTVLGVSLSNSNQRQGSVSEFRSSTAQAIDIATDNLGSAPWTVNVLGYCDPV